MQLRGQHRECCALRGKGWGTTQSTVAYIARYPYAKLFRFHKIVMTEIEKRGGVKIDPVWHNPQWRGKQITIDETEFTACGESAYGEFVYGYPEHDIQYYNECLCNLMGKGKVIEINGKRYFAEPVAVDGKLVKLRCAEYGLCTLFRWYRKD